MKKSQLNKLIREGINKYLNEKTEWVYQVSHIDGEEIMRGTEEEIKEWLWQNTNYKIEEL